MFCTEKQLFRQVSTSGLALHRLRGMPVGYVIDDIQVTIGVKPWVLSLASVSTWVLEENVITTSMEL